MAVNHIGFVFGDFRPNKKRTILKKKNHDHFIRNASSESMCAMRAIPFIYLKYVLILPPKQFIDCVPNRREKKQKKQEASKRWAPWMKIIQWFSYFLYGFWMQKAKRIIALACVWHYDFNMCACVRVMSRCAQKEDELQIAKLPHGVHTAQNQLQLILSIHLNSYRATHIGHDRVYTTITVLCTLEWIRCSGFLLSLIVVLCTFEECDFRFRYATFSCQHATAVVHIKRVTDKSK